MTENWKHAGRRLGRRRRPSKGQKGLSGRVTREKRPSGAQTAFGQGGIRFRLYFLCGGSDPPCLRAHYFILRFDRCGPHHARPSLVDPFWSWVAYNFKPSKSNGNLFCSPAQPLLTLFLPFLSNPTKITTCEFSYSKDAIQCNFVERESKKTKPPAENKTELRCTVRLAST